MDSADKPLSISEMEAIVGIHPDAWKAVDKWARKLRERLANAIDSDRDADARNEYVGQRKALLRIINLKQEMQDSLDKSHRVG